MSKTEKKRSRGKRKDDVKEQRASQGDDKHGSKKKRRPPDKTVLRCTCGRVIGGETERGGVFGRKYISLIEAFRIMDEVKSRCPNCSRKRLS